MCFLRFDNIELQRNSERESTHLTETASNNFIIILSLHFAFRLSSLFYQALCWIANDYAHDYIFCLFFLGVWNVFFVIHCIELQT